ncbi:MAG: outer membrane lipoprotein carrier protein LolA, partial [Candidatus Acidiferrales bacterium]
MKRMKQRKRVLQAAGICLLVAVAAGEADAQPSAQEVAARVERHYNRVETLAADFVQRYTLGRTTLVESGRVYFKKPGRMRWEYNSPE